jgi:hypothetical protein
VNKINRHDSILYKTGQAWKFWFMPFGVAVGIIPFLEAEQIKDSGQNHLFIVFLLLSICIEIISLVLPATMIRCPRCGARWYWLAIARQNNGSWYDRLFSRNCPICNLSENSNRRSMGSDSIDRTRAYHAVQQVLSTNLKSRMRGIWHFVRQGDPGRSK